MASSRDASITWMIESRIEPEQLEQVRQLAAELTAMCLSEEPGTSAYEWAVDPSGSRAHIYERYDDSEAAMAHIRLFEARFAARFRSLVRPERLIVIGNPSAELQASLAYLSPIVMQPMAGFYR